MIDFGFSKCKSSEWSFNDCILDDFFGCKQDIDLDYLVKIALNDQNYYWLDAHGETTTKCQEIVKGIWKKLLGDKLSDYAGMEYWVTNGNPNGDVGKHVDRAEIIYTEKGIDLRPKYGAIYYPIEYDIKGGEFVVIEGGMVTKVATPKMDRLVTLDVGNLTHYVERWEGHRVAIATNIWEFKPQDFPPEKI